MLRRRVARLPARRDALADLPYGLATRTRHAHLHATAGLPVRASRREACHSLVVAGGHRAFNPEPLAALVDVFALGDGEDFELCLVVSPADAACGESAETLAARPAWDTMTAVQDGRIFPVDADLASRWGPRIVDFVQTISDAVAAVEEPADA